MGNNYTPEYNNASQFLDNEDSDYYEVTTTGYDKRENPRIDYIDASFVGGGPVWDYGPTAPDNWDIDDDSKYREWIAHAADDLTVTEIYEFNELPLWASQAKTKELNLEIRFAVGSCDYDYSCKLYFYDWYLYDWKTDPTCVFDYDSWDARSITIPWQCISEDKVHV